MNESVKVENPEPVGDKKMMTVDLLKEKLGAELRKDVIEQLSLMASNRLENK